MLRQLKAGSAGVILPVFLQDSGSATGDGLPGLAFNTAGLSCYYVRDSDAAPTAVALATMALGVYVSGGFKKIDDANLPGLYQFCPPNAALAVGAKSVVFFFRGAAGLAHTPVLVELTATDNQDAAAGGLSDLPAILTAVNGLKPGMAGALLVGDTILLTRGDDYKSADGRALLWDEDPAAGWPDLTGAALSLQIGVLAAAGTREEVTVQRVRVELDDAATNLLAAGQPPYRLVATLANGDTITLRRGKSVVA